jgi:hypothetical protein
MHKQSEKFRLVRYLQKYLCSAGAYLKSNEIKNSVSSELNAQQLTVWKLAIHCYGLQVLQHVTPNDEMLSYEFCSVTMGYLCARMNRHTVWVWVNYNSCNMVQYIRDTLKANVFCAVTSDKVYEPSFFVKKTINETIVTCWRSGWCLIC